MKIKNNVSQIKEMVDEIRRLSTMNLGLIGFGQIARAVTNKIKVSRFHIMAYDPYLSEDIFIKWIKCRNEIPSKEVRNYYCVLF